MMSAENKIKRFVKGRDEALLSFDFDRYKKWVKTWCKNIPSDDVLEAAMYKQICESREATMLQKQKAEAWLKAHGMYPGFSIKDGYLWEKKDLSWRIL